MIAKPGLDGHERGAVVVAQGLRDAGFDVIYTGLRRTPKQIAIAAAQEDVDVLGLSVLSGAHMTALTTVAKELDALSWTPSLLLAGGIIPAADEAALKQQGFDLVFGPGTPLSTIGDSIRQRVPARCGRKSDSASPWVNTSAALTRIELSEEPEAKVPATRDTAHRIILLEGQGGVGKSTLIGEFIHLAVGQEQSIAVLANDPVGAQGRGAILADRLRMPMAYPAEQCFIRSLPVRDAAEGIATGVPQMARHLAQDYDLVIVETLGLGQHQYPDADWADLSVAAVAPGSGDQWQLRKSAILDLCDQVFITKADTPNFDSFRNDVLEVLHDKRTAALPRIVSVSQNDEASLSEAFASLFR